MITKCVSDAVVVQQPQARRKATCYEQTAHYHFMVIAGSLMEISGNFHDKLFIRSLKTEETSVSSASMLATPLISCNHH